MNKATKGPSSSSNLRSVLGKIFGSVEQRYADYRQALAMRAETLSMPNGLPATTVSLGFAPLLFSLADHAHGDPAQARLLTVWDALRQSSRLLIVGPAGAGKSALLNMLAWKFIQEPDVNIISGLTVKLFGTPEEEIMPLLVDLRDYDQSALSLEETLTESMARHGFPRAGEFLANRLEQGGCLVMLDGLEYVTHAEKRSQILALAEAYPRNIWLVTMRPQAEPLIGFTSLWLRGIGVNEAATLAQRTLKAAPSAANDLIATYERHDSMAQWAEVPLLALTLCRAQLQKSGGVLRLPALYDAGLAMLLEEWDHRGGRSTRYALADKLQVLHYIAWQMQSHEQVTLDRATLLAAISSQLEQAAPAQVEDLCAEFAERTGVLYATGGPSSGYAFILPVFQSYLAAQWIMATQQTASLVARADDPWWRETIVATASLLPDPLPFLEKIEAQGRREPYKWFLLARCLSELPGPSSPLHTRVSEQLAALLQGEQAELWSPAVVGLAGMARKPSRDYLSALAKDTEALLRRRAALAMGRLAQEWAIAPLSSAISDPDPAVREQAAWALGFIPSSQSVRALPRALRSPFRNVREMAAASLAQLGQRPDLIKSVIPELIGAVDDENHEVVLGAEAAILRIGQTAVPFLTASLNDTRLRPAQHSRVAKALGRLGDEHALPVLINAILTATPEDLGGYVDALAGVGANAVPALVEALVGRDVTTSAGLIGALVRIGAPAVEPLIEAIAGTSPEVRNAATRALEQIGEPAVELLIQAMLRDSRYEVRRVALNILGRIGAVRIIAALISALDDSDIGVRTNAIRYLGNFNDPAAVPPLLEVLRTTTPEQVSLRRPAITSLSHIGDARAVLPILETSKDPLLREAAVTALTELGEKAVEPLIEQLHVPSTPPEVREVIWMVLEQVGAPARPDSANMVGLAWAYAKLRDASLPPTEAAQYTERLYWWEHGYEVHRSLVTAIALAEVRELSKIADCAPDLEWVGEIQHWLRPHIGEVLRRLRNVVDDIKIYRTQTRRDSQRDSLLSAIDRLDSLQKEVDATALPFEQGYLTRAISAWRASIGEAVKQLRGRASLMITLLTPNMPIHAAQQSVTVVFGLFNEGDSAARNLSITVRPSALHGVEVVNGDNRKLDPLGIGEERQVDIAILSHGLHQAEMIFEAHYDDDENQGATHRFSCHVGFFEAPTGYVPIRNSPYIVGVPVKTTQMFFGRQDIFQWVRDNISGQFQQNALLLYGERRMGKTSVLYQLQQTPPTPNHICLLLDLQTFSYVNTVNELLFEIATGIVARLTEEGYALEEPNWDHYSSNPHRAFRTLVTLIDKTLGERRLLVMLDEFGVLIVKVRDHAFDVSIFEFLRSIVQHSTAFNFMFTGAYEVRHMQQDYGSVLFNIAKVRRISYLEPGEATDLIQKPVEGLLTYHPMVITKIHNVTACHPYFVQYICDEMVQLARNGRKNYIELTDLDIVIRDVVRDATGNIENSIYLYLSDTEKLVLAALANVTDDVRVFVPMGDVSSLLERRGMGITRTDLENALRALVERDLLTEMRIGQQLRYSFRMGLIRLWLKQNEILLRLSQHKEA
jgi:HEAT repeat protein/energy-coupling factor transporter ATP-binding protein EcfA2